MKDMAGAAEIEQSKFGVVIRFPPKASINSDIYKMLISAGFERCGAMGWNHWRHEAITDATISKAIQIVDEFNAHKPARKQKLYPIMKKA